MSGDGPLTNFNYNLYQHVVAVIKFLVNHFSFLDRKSIFWFFVLFFVGAGFIRPELFGNIFKFLIN